MENAQLPVNLFFWALAAAPIVVLLIIPAILFERDEPYMAYGTMGGEGQPQTHAAIVTRLVDFGYDVQQAIEAPRWLMGRTWGASAQDLSLEGRIPDEVIRELRSRGQPVKVLEDWNVLQTQGINTLFFTGVNTDQCVTTTMEDAYFHDYNALLLSDAASTSSPDYCKDAVVFNAKNRWGFVADTERFAEARPFEE